ncbi:MAG: hypothetical protein ACOC3X_03480 [Nanoarchaeota archaeon]
MVIHIRHKGVFDQKKLVQAVLDWFSAGDYEHYFYLTKSKSTDFGAEEEYGIRGWYNETEYHRVNVDVYLHIYDANVVEVEENSEKKQMIKGAIHITVDGKIEKDFAGQFNQSTFTKKLQEFMESKVIKQRYDVIWEDDMHYRLQGLANYLKDFLNFNTVGKYF